MDTRYSDRQMAELAMFVHGALAGLHVLGVVYNFRRRNWWDVAAHAAAAVYDTHSVVKHAADCRDYQ